MSTEALPRVIAPSAGKKVRQTIYFDPEVLKTLKHEAIDREMSLSELVDEAVRTRIHKTWK